MLPTSRIQTPQPRPIHTAWSWLLQDEAHLQAACQPGNFKFLIIRNSHQKTALPILPGYHAGFSISRSPVHFLSNQRQARVLDLTILDCILLLRNRTSIAYTLRHTGKLKLSRGGAGISMPSALGPGAVFSSIKDCSSFVGS